MSKAVFDPGFYNCLTSFSSNVELLYSQLEGIKNFNMKKLQYRATFQRIKNLLDAHTGFYVGCMLWGTYLKSLGSEKLENNPFVNQEWDKELSLSEINYIFEFVKKLEKDSKYYLGKPYKFEESKKVVLEKYIEFINANEGFTKCDTTDKIVLTNNLQQISKEEIDKIEEKIQEVIHTGKVEELLEFCDKI